MTAASPAETEIGTRLVPQSVAAPRWFRPAASATILYNERDDVEESRMKSLQRPKIFEVRAEWDAEAAVWWCSNEELPLTTEAPTFEQLVSRVLEIAPEIAAENRLATPGEEIEVHAIAERVQSVPVVAAA